MRRMVWNSGLGAVPGVLICKDADVFKMASWLRTYLQVNSYLSVAPCGVAFGPFGV